MIRNNVNRILVASASTAMVVGIFGACPATSQTASYRIYTVQDTVSLHRSGTSVSFRVTTIVKNTDTRDLYISNCSPASERMVDSGWVVVFDQPCTYDNPGHLSAGDSLVIDVVEARNLANVDPSLAPVGAGIYRLAFAGGYYQDQFTIVWSPPNSVASLPFFVRDSSAVH